MPSNYNMLDSLGSMWMQYGAPFIIPQAGTGRWDGSKWIATGNKNSSTSTLPSATLGMNDSTNDPRTTTSFSVSPAMTGNLNTGALGMQIGDRFYGGLSNSALGSLKGAGLAGAAGTLLGGLSTGLNAGLSVLTGPASVMNMMSGAVNGVTGVSSNPGAQAAIAGLATAALGPMGGVLGTVLGGPLADLAMDAFNGRSMEQVRDAVEDISGSYLGGRHLGSAMVNALEQNTLANPSMTIAQTMANFGMNPSQDNLTAVLNGVYGNNPTAVRDALTEISLGAMTPEQQASLSSLQNEINERNANALADQVVLQSKLNNFGGIDGVAGMQTPGSLTTASGLTNSGLYSNISIDPATGMAYSDPFGFGPERAPSFDVENLSQPAATSVQSTGVTGVTSGFEGIGGQIAEFNDLVDSITSGMSDADPDNESNTSSEGVDNDSDSADNSGNDSGSDGGFDGDSVNGGMGDSFGGSDRDSDSSDSDKDE